MAQALEAAARAACKQGGFDPDEVMPNDGPRWRYYLPGAEAAVTAYLAALGDGWRPIETAPKEGAAIVGWCVHDANPYHDATTDRLTDYGCHAEGLSHVPDGPHVLVWGGGDWDINEFSGETLTWPDWWFRFGSEFEEVANPTHWRPLPTPPGGKK